MGIASWLDRQLKRKNMNFRRDGNLQGVRPDFVLRAADGREFALDVKAWEPTPSLLQRAKQQARRYTDLAGADGAFIVVEGLKHSRPDDGLLAPEEAIEILTETMGAPARLQATTKTAKRGTRVEDRLIFAAMPFHKRYQDTFWFGMVPAAKAVSAACKRLDVNNFSEEILSTMRSWIRNSVAVIADLSGSNPNVLYEVGYAHALGKPTIHLCSTALDKLPFDLKTWPTIPYEIGAVSELTPKLIKQLSETLNRGN